VEAGQKTSEQAILSDLAAKSSRAIL